MREIKIAWWSAGITSAIACKIALEMYDNIKLYYIETGKAHPDNARFKSDCERWYGQKIETVTNRKGYTSPIDVVLKTGYVNGPDGARCTLELKKEVRYDIERLHEPGLFNQEILTNQVFGFEHSPKEINRAIRFLQQYPRTNALFPLIERKITKSNCAGMLLNAGIELPKMYALGYSNNNCIGCVKGGKGYWNKIRTDFPEVFNEMANAERNVNHSCIKGVYLDELDPTAGNDLKEIIPDCGTFCEVELQDIPAKHLDDVINGKINVYDAAKKAA